MSELLRPEWIAWQRQNAGEALFERFLAGCNILWEFSGGRLMPAAEPPRYADGTLSVHWRAEPGFLSLTVGRMGPAELFFHGGTRTSVIVAPLPLDAYRLPDDILLRLPLFYREA